MVFYKIDGSTANINDMTNVECDFYSSIYPQQPHKIAIWSNKRFFCFKQSNFWKKLKVQVYGP